MDKKKEPVGFLRAKRLTAAGFTNPVTVVKTPGRTAAPFTFPGLGLVEQVRVHVPLPNKVSMSPSRRSALASR